jgi:hypothetical protein
MSEIGISFKSFFKSFTNLKTDLGNDGSNLLTKSDDKKAID